MMRFKILVINLLVIAVWQSAFAYNFSAVAPSGQTLYYNIVGGNAQVTYQTSSYQNYSNLTGSLDIPSSVTYAGTTYSVTSIGNDAFWRCSGLTSVTIPGSVTSIGNDAFSYCSGLTSVTIPNSVTSIGNWAFSGCSGLTSVTIPNSVTSIGDGAFARCSGLTSVTIPNSVTSISKSAFWDCSGLTSVTIPGSVTSIGNEAFWDCSGLTSVTIPNSVTSIGNSAFSGCSGLTSVTIPNSVTSIGNFAFRGCSGLTSVTIPNSVTSIGNSAFRGCSGLTSVTIPSFITSIGESVFRNCSSLSAVTIPDAVTSIGDSAFSGCCNLTTVTIPANVTDIGKSAFKNCSGLTTVHFNADSCTYAGSSYSYRAFYGCNNITTFTFGNNVKIIPSYLCYDMDSLTSVTIPNSVTHIWSEAFSGCSSLTRTNYTGTAAQWCRIFFVDNPIEYTHNLYINDIEATDIIIPDNSIRYISSGAFKNCYSLRSVYIGDSVRGIGDEAFLNCANLHTVSIPKSVTGIRDKAFSDCNSLQRVNYNAVNCNDNDVLWRPSSPFSTTDGSNCIHATLCIGPDVQTIPDKMFYGWRGLTSLVMSSSATSIGRWAFSECTNLREAVLSNSLTTIEDYAFQNCTSMTSIVVPDMVTHIGRNAFKGCENLASVTLGKSVQQIDSAAFSECLYLLSLNSKNTRPPDCGENVFSVVPTNYCRLTIPCEATPYYNTKMPWSVAFPNKSEDCRTEYAINAISDNPEMGYVIGWGVAMAGDTIKLYAISNPGYRFQRWQDGNTDSVRTVTVTGNATYTAYFAETVGIEDVEGYDQSGLRLYPNPAHSSVTVTGLEPGRRIALVDLYGRTLADLHASSTELTIDVSALSPGTYFVRVEGLPAQKVVVIN